MKVENVAIDSVSPHPSNARKGNISAIAKSIEEVGVYKPVIVQKSTSYILAGNHTYKALKSLGRTSIDVVFIDCDNNKAKKILVLDNSTSDMSTYDYEKLHELIKDVDIDSILTKHSLGDAQIKKLSGFSLPSKEDFIKEYIKESSNEAHTTDLLMAVSKLPRFDIMESINMSKVRPELAALLEIRRSFFYCFDFDIIAKFYEEEATDYEKEALKAFGMVIEIEDV